MRVHIATDHAGMELSQYLVEQLTADGYEMIDHGPEIYDALDDYPAFCIHAAQAVMEDRARGLDSLGVVLGGSGNGEQMAANKVPGVRAALAWNLSTAQLAREHNDAQVVALGGRQHTPDEGLEIVRAFLSTSFSFDERHVRRINQITEFERTGTVAGHLDGLTARPYLAESPEA
ncbi:ribose-5-phosphate isomerase [Kocuria sp.]|uniref:ribose-5-phosphate isomerase n=1 Tax=Kocuria sp. TaxID=1871328 RepID=UPI0026E0C31B|nr:ribose-5-phosphate isomerase [Kocuria sp.]MDO5618407.1 ribose-5-phosphate isomerase [Kocuria sp.]